jgi:hypothetical protein
MMERESAAAPRGGAAKRPLAPNAQRQEMTRLHLATLCVGGSLALLGSASAGCASTTAQTTATEPSAPQVASAEDAIARADAERGTLCGADVSLASISSSVWPFPEGGAWLAHVVCFEGAYQPSARLALVDAAGVVTALPLPLRMARKASCGISTARPIDFMRFLPSFCFSRSLRLRLMSPP